MNDFSDLLYVVEVSPNFYQVRISALEHLIVSAVTGYEKALNCVREFVLNYKTPDNLLKEMRELIKTDRYGDKSLREKQWESLSPNIKLDVEEVIEKAYHDPEFKKRKKFESVSMRMKIEEEETQTAEIIKQVLILPRKIAKKKRKPILVPLV